MPDSSFKRRALIALFAIAVVSIASWDSSKGTAFRTSGPTSTNRPFVASTTNGREEPDHAGNHRPVTAAPSTEGQQRSDSPTDVGSKKINDDTHVEKDSSPPLLKGDEKPSSGSLKLSRVDITSTDIKAKLAACPSGADETVQEPHSSSAAIDAKITKLRPIKSPELWSVGDEEIDTVCRNAGLSRRPKDKIPKLIYAAMFGVELRMLQVLLHEIYPIVDAIFLTESTVSHSLLTKKVIFEKVKDEWFSPFLDKISHHVFTPSKKFKSGWDIEKRQRGHFMKVLERAAYDQQHAKSATHDHDTDKENESPKSRKSLDLSKLKLDPDDIILGNIDLDEIFTREALVQMKYCDLKIPQQNSIPFTCLQFRYNLNCIQDQRYVQYGGTVFHWGNAQSRKSIDLYRRRVWRSLHKFDPTRNAGVLMANRSAWHMSAFGGVESVVVKYQNSPHRFVGDRTLAQIKKDIDTCTYQDEKRFPLLPDKETGDPWFVALRKKGSWPELPLPYLVAKHPCQFRKEGWI